MIEESSTDMCDTWEASFRHWKTFDTQLYKLLIFHQIYWQNTVLLLLHSVFVILLGYVALFGPNLASSKPMSAISLCMGYCQVVCLTEYPRPRQPNIMIRHVALPVEETTKFLGLWWDSKLNFGKHITELKKQSKEAINLLRVVAHTKWGGDRDTLLMLYRAIVRSKLDYGCIVYGSASTSSLNKLNTIHNTGLRLALGAFCTSPVWSLYVEANEPPLEERRLKLSMHYFLKICAMPDNPAYLAMNKFDRSTKQLYKVRPNGRGGMIRPPTAPVGLRMKAAMKEADIDTSKISPLDIPDLPPGTHAFDPESDNLIEGVTKVEISSSHAKAKFQEYLDEQGNHDEVYTDGSKINAKVGAAAVIKRLFQDGKTTRNLSKRLPDGSSIFSAEATAIILALDYYNAMPAVRHDVVIYSDSLSCLQAIQGEDTEHPLMCRIMNLLWKLSDKGTHVKFCWIPSHCGIEGNEAADKLAKESLGLNIDALLGIFHADLKPQVNAYVQQLMQVKWDVEVHGRDLYLLKANLAPPDRYKHLKRAEEVAMTRLRIGHCKATKGHIVSRGPPAVCHHCGSTLSREHILLECGTVQELRGEFYEADSLTSLFECVRPLAIIEYLKEAGFFYLIWQVYECEIRNVKSHKPQNPDYHIIEEDKWIAENIRKMCRTANMSWRTCVVVKQTQSHPIPSPPRGVVKSTWVTINWGYNASKCNDLGHRNAVQTKIETTNPLRRSDTVWLLRSGSTLAQVMAVHHFQMQCPRKAVEFNHSLGHRHAPFRIKQTEIINQLWPCDAIWWHRCGSTLA